MTGTETTDLTWGRDWLVGLSDGLYRGQPGARWELAGPYQFNVTCVARSRTRLVIGSDGGLWEPRPDALWRQLHDEILTVVQDVALVPGDPGLLGASLYGVHAARVDELGVCRWRNCSDGLAVDARACASLLVDEGAPLRWLAGTEAGLLVTDDGGANWECTAISDTAVRALLRANDRFWAGTDGGGIWVSDDGYAWHREAAVDAPVFSLARVADGRLLAGTGKGVLWGDGDGSWRSTGPRIWAQAVGADPVETGRWVSGGSLGGLWWTADGGDRWQQVAGMNGSTGAICPPLVEEV